MQCEKLLDREQKASIIDIMKSSKIREIFGGEKVFRSSVIPKLSGVMHFKKDILREGRIYESVTYRCVWKCWPQYA